MNQQPSDTPSGQPAFFIAWLLNASTPSIRYLTLRHLLDRPETDTGVRTARQDMKTTGPIPTILAGQTETGHWDGERSYYTPKYTSTHWSMLLLAELAFASAAPESKLAATWLLAEPVCWWANWCR